MAKISGILEASACALCHCAGISGPWKAPALGALLEHRAQSPRSWSWALWAELLWAVQLGWAQGGCEGEAALGASSHWEHRGDSPGVTEGCRAHA